MCKDGCDDLGKNWEVSEWQDDEVCEYAHVGYVVLCRGREGQGKEGRGREEEEKREEGGRRKEGGGRKEGGREGKRKRGEEGKEIRLCMLHCNPL